EKLVADPTTFICVDVCEDYPTDPRQGGWDARYQLGGKVVAQRYEETVDYQYIRDQAKWPEEALAATEAATTGQNTQGNAVEAQAVSWRGTYTPSASGTHKLRLYSSSYATVFADGKQLLHRWRPHWNPWYHLFALELEAGEPVELRPEWESNHGYIALERAGPLPGLGRHSVSVAGEAGKAIDYYVVPAPTMDEAIAGYRRLTGKAPMMPRWAYGFWQSRQRYNTAEELLDVMRQY